VAVAAARIYLGRDANSGIDKANPLAVVVGRLGPFGHVNQLPGIHQGKFLLAQEP
jgi:hypothetical protein